MLTPVQAPSPGRFKPDVEATTAAAVHAEQHQRTVDRTKVWDLDLNSDMDSD